MVVYGDSGYIGIEKRPEIVENLLFSKIEFRIARRYKSVQVLPETCPAWEKHFERRKASVRSKDVRPFSGKGAQKYGIGAFLRKTHAKKAFFDDLNIDNAKRPE